MSTKAFYDLKDMLCMEVDEIAKKQEMSAGDLDAVHKLTDTIKNIDKILMLEEDGGILAAATGRPTCAAPITEGPATAIVTAWVAMPEMAMTTTAGTAGMKLKIT